MNEKFFLAKSILTKEGPKLFLCSRIIEDNDVFYSELYPNQKYSAVGNWREKHDLDFLYKILKQLSPEACWVKEGDEFEAEEFQPYNKTLDIPIRFEYIGKPIVSYIRIWNHNCKHFH
jgi:hypothetical protein